MSVGKLIANNKKARHEFFIDEVIETGIVLKGTEVKSVRMGQANIKESYAVINDGEVFIQGMNITPYEMGNRYNPDPVRTRKLLLHRRQIDKLIGLTMKKGYTLVPLRLYLNEKGLVKLEIGVARGKKLHDKRHDLAKKDATRDIQRALKDKQKY
ncbi:MAG: SsrA-binding protein SmpB [Clostridiales bacterium]|nr:SsrA-binding protein SmpB [Clostridiales bacterium]